MNQHAVGIVATMLFVLSLAASPAFAHLDTLMQVLAPPPLVKEFEAENLPGVPLELIVKDPEAQGALAVRAAPHTPVFRVDLGELERGMYVIYIIAKVTDPNAWVGEELKPLNIALRLQGPGDLSEFWSMRCPFDMRYHDVARLYLHAPEKGRYVGEIFVDDRSQVQPVVDRIQLRNVLAGFTFQAVKSQRVLYTDAEIQGMRQAAEREKKVPRPLPARALSPAEREARDAVMWNAVMPINANPAGDQLYWGIGRGHETDRPIIAARVKQLLGKEPGTWEMAFGQAYDQPWKLVNKALGLEYTLADYNMNRPLPQPWPVPEDKGAFFYDKETWGTSASFNFGTVPEFMRARYHAIVKAIGGGYHARDSLVARYLLAGDLEAASDAAFLLVAYAYRYPSYDFLAHVMANVYKKGWRFSPGNNGGRGTGYAGWSTGTVVGILQSYDALFPYIKDNEELARRVGRFVPWVKSSRDVIALIDTFLVQRAAQDGINHVLYSPATPWAAVVLGPNEVSRRFLDTYFRGMYLRNTLSGFPDSIINGYSRDGLNYIGSTYYVQGESAEELGGIVDLLARYARTGGDDKFNLADPRRYPKLAALPGSLFDLYVAGGYSSNIGDVASPDGPRRLNPDPKTFETLYRRAWQQQRDSRFAWLLANRIGQGEFTDAEWEEVKKVAQSAKDPFLHQQSRHLGGFGLAVMEEGADNPDYRQKRTVTIRTGVGSGHAHPDSLDLQFWAHGLRVLSDLGGRLMGSYGKPSCMTSYVHNLVEVDEKSFTGGVQNSTGTAWLHAFKPLPGAQFTLAAARGESHPHVSLYRRATALIAVDQRNAYVFDVFRVRGGNIHTWCFKGVPPDEFTVNAPLAEATSEVAQKYLARHRPGSQREGVAGNLLEATWRLRRTVEKVQIGDKEITLHNSEQSMLERDYDPNSPPKFTRVTLLGHGGNSILVGNWYCTEFKGREFDWPFLYVRQEGKNESTWPAIIQAYEGEPHIFSVEPLTMSSTAAQGQEKPPNAAALRITAKNGCTDILFESDTPQPCRLGDQPEERCIASGQFSFVRLDAGGVALMHLVGGSTLSYMRNQPAESVELRPQKHAHVGRIIDVDYDNMRFTVSGHWPVRLIAGQELTIFNDRHITNCRAVRGEHIGENTCITFEKSAAIYQGGIEHILTDGSAAVLDLAPDLYDYHPAYYDGMTVINEAGHALGKAKLSLGDRFMYLGWPEWHRHLQRIRMEDIPDANGDGKRTVRMFAAEPIHYLQENGTIATKQPGELMLELEVTRIRDDGFMFWYKQHPRIYLDSLKAPHPGWPYHKQILKNEDGSRTWTSYMPGDTYLLTVEGRRLAPADFPDTDGDGRPLVRLYDFGPGDTVTLPTHVYLRRLDGGHYELRTDVPVQVTIAGKANSFDEEALGDGILTFRLPE